jgi:transcriptional regulator with XRE-family HTH domain
MPILQNVRQLRQARGVKPAAFAEQVRCSTAHMRSVENGWRSASPELAARIAKELGVEVDKLSVPDEPPPQPKPAPKPKSKPRPKGPKRVKDIA